MHIEENQLRDFILDSGLVSRADMETAQKKAVEKGQSLGKILVSQGKIGENDLRRIHAYVLGIPFVDLTKSTLLFDTLALIPEPISRNHNIVAFNKNTDILEVALLDMSDLPIIAFLEEHDLKIVPRLTSSDSIRSALMNYQKGLKNLFGDSIQKDALNFARPNNFIDNFIEDESTVRIVDNLLQHALTQHASDIHFEPTESELLVRYRINGSLHDAMVLPKNTAEPVIGRIKMLAKLEIHQKHLPQDGRFSVTAHGEKNSFRVSTIPTFHGEKAVLRLLREYVSGFTLETLGFHGTGLNNLHKAFSTKSGVILTVGPNGSGKTTTTYTLLDIINAPKVSVATIEDGIEHHLKRITQTQIRPEIGFTFVSGLRSLVRQDPDVIMVGEMRDAETASLALTTALGGRTILSTMPTGSVAETLIRLTSLGIDPFLISSTVHTIIVQRLARKIIGSTEKYFLTKKEIETLEKFADMKKVLAALKEEKMVSKSDTWEKIPFYRPKKGATDIDSYAGTIGIVEVFRMNSAVKDVLMKNPHIDALQKHILLTLGDTLTLAEDGIFKAALGLTTIEEILRVIQ